MYQSGTCFGRYRRESESNCNEDGERFRTSSADTNKVCFKDERMTYQVF